MYFTSHLREQPNYCYKPPHTLHLTPHDTLIPYYIISSTRHLIIHTPPNTLPYCITSSIHPPDTSPCSQVFVVVEYLFAEFVDKLIEHQVDLGLDLIVEKLLVEVVQSIVCTVAVQIQGIEDVPVKVGTQQKVEIHLSQSATPNLGRTCGQNGC